MNILHISREIIGYERWVGRLDLFLQVLYIRDMESSMKDFKEGPGRRGPGSIIIKNSRARALWSAHRTLRNGEQSKELGDEAIQKHLSKSMAAVDG